MKAQEPKWLTRDELIAENSLLRAELRYMEAKEERQKFVNHHDGRERVELFSLIFNELVEEEISALAELEFHRAAARKAKRGKR